MITNEQTNDKSRGLDPSEQKLTIPASTERKTSGPLQEGKEQLTTFDSIVLPSFRTAWLSLPRTLCHLSIPL